MKKYQSEMEFCSKVTELLLGLLHGTGREVIAVPEVPHHYFSNDHIDMMLLDIKNFELMFIEYKLNTPSKLDSQIKDRNNKGLNCIGIINTYTKYIPNKYGCNLNDIFSFTGRDIEVDRLSERLMEKYTWKSIYQNGMVYYWAYKNQKSSFEGGFKNGKREMYWQIYLRAIQNLHIQYGKLDFMLTHSALASNYSVAISKKYYKMALKESQI